MKVGVDVDDQDIESSSLWDTLNRWWNVLEYYVFLIIGSSFWIYGAINILTWQRFPFHNHLLEVGAILLLPITILAAMLTFTDRTLKSKEL